MSLFNFNLSFGVDIDRSLNLPINDYSYTGTLQKIKELASEEVIRENSGNDFDKNIWENELDSLSLYINYDAPANIIISITAFFKGNQPLTLVKDNKDLIYTDNQSEIHIIKFESESLRLNNQGDMLITGQFDNIIKIFRENQNSLFEREWIITDIDNILQGNPFLKEK